MNPFVDAATRMQRMDTCKVCEHFIRVAGQPKCNLCHCWLGAKTAFSGQHCPLNKW